VEASACGRCVIASNIGGIPDVISDGETGMVLPADDAPRWAATMIACSTQKERLHDMGRRGRVKTQTFFDARDYGTKLMALYRLALKERLPA
jgi:starch synthase